MARTSMSAIITILRAKINDSTSAIWTDDQLQNYLDMHRVHIRREKLEKDIQKENFYSSYQALEADAALYSGDDSDSSEVTPTSSNLVDGTFTFSTAQESDLYLDAKSYDINGAIAECLDELVTDVSRAKSWSRGGVKFTHYDLMALSKHFRSLSAPQSRKARRTYQ